MSLITKQQKLAELRPLSPEAAASLSAAWDVRMVYESNSIEGNSLTLRETELVLSKGITVSGKPLKDHLETVNLAKAWEQVKDLVIPNSNFVVQNLMVFNMLVLKEGDGYFRENSVGIVGATHSPPSPEMVPSLTYDLFSETAKLSNPVERAAKIHHGVASIHPFVDGNGRTARLAMNFILLSAGYPPISIPTELRQDYYNALEAADSGDFPTWQSFLETQLHQELDLYLEALTPNK